MSIATAASGCTQQPQWAPRINWANPFTRGLVFAVTGQSLVDATGNYGSSDVSSQVINAFGVATDRNAPRTFSTSRSQADVSRTALLRCKNDVTSGSNRLLISAGLGGVSGFGFGFSTNNQSPSYVDFGVAGYVATTELFLNSNECRQFVCRRDRGSANDVRWYNDYGIQLGSAVAAGSYNSGSYPVMVEWEANLALLWERALTDGEIVTISANPWQVFAAAR